MKALHAILGATAALAAGAIALTIPSAPARADAMSCANLVPTINVNLGTVIDSFQPIATRVQAMTLSVNTFADCLGVQHPTPGCFNSASYRLPFAIANLAYISGMGTGFARQGQSFPNSSVNGDVGFVYSQLAFYVNEIGGCTN